MSTSFASSDEFFRAVRGLADRLDADGHPSAAAEVRSGLSCLNGLTDGWALLGESLDGVRASHGDDLTAEQCAELDELVAVVWDVVHRR